MLTTAKAFLVDLLSAGPLWVKDIKDEAAGAELSWATVRRAQAALGIRPRKVGKPRSDEQGWKWGLGGEDAHQLPKVPIPQGRASSENVSIFGESPNGNHPPTGVTDGGAR